MQFVSSKEAYYMTVVKRVIGLLVVLGTSACTNKVKEFDNAIPTDVEWLLTPTRLSITLSDLRYPSFVEIDSNGAVVGVPKFYPEQVDTNIGACQGQTAALSKYWDELVKLNNAMLSNSPDINAGQVAEINQSAIGKFELLNTQGLWFHSGRLQTQAFVSASPSAGGAPVPLQGSASVGTKSRNVLLAALVGSFKFSVSDDLRNCIKAAYQNTEAFKNSFKKFSEAAAKRNHIAKAVFYRGAVTGSLIGLRIREVEWDSNVNFDAGGAINGEASVEFSNKNISINYQQNGLMASDFGVKSFLEYMDGDADPAKALGFLRRKTERMAVVGLIPVELELDTK